MNNYKNQNTRQEHNGIFSSFKLQTINWQTITNASHANLMGTGEPGGVLQVFRLDRGNAFLNHPPTATDVLTSTPAGNAVLIEMNGNDLDSDALTFSIAELPTYGKLFDGNTADDVAEITSTGYVVHDAENHVTYLPATDFTGTDVFTFTVKDAHGASDAATVTVTVTELEAPSPQLTLTSERFVMAAGVSESIITQDLFEVTDPANLDEPDPAEIWIEILSEPANGILLDEDQIVLHQGDSVLLADFPLIYEALNGEVFATEWITFRAFGAAWTSDPVDLEVVVGAILQTLSFQEGWNLISFKMNPLDAVPASMFAGNEGAQAVQSIWYWETDVTEYEQADTLIGGQGYWVYVSGGPLIIEDIPGSPILNLQLSIFEGWNLVGPVGYGSERDAPNATGIIQGPPWYWNEFLQRYETALRIYEGRGYWILSLTDSSVNLEMLPQ